MCRLKCRLLIYKLSSKRTFLGGGEIKVVGHEKNFVGARRALVSRLDCRCRRGRECRHTQHRREHEQPTHDTNAKAHLRGVARTITQLRPIGVGVRSADGNEPVVLVLVVEVGSRVVATLEGRGSVGQDGAHSAIRREGGGYATVAAAGGGGGWRRLQRLRAATLLLAACCWPLAATSRTLTRKRSRGPRAASRRRGYF